MGAVEDTAGAKTERRLKGEEDAVAVAAADTGTVAATVPHNSLFSIDFPIVLSSTHLELPR